MLPPSPNEPQDETTVPTAAEMVVNQLTKVFGDSGTRRYSGYFIEDYNPEWRDDERVTLVEEMRRGDATIRAALRAIKSPMLSTDWNIVCDEDDEKAEEIRLFVEQNLFNMRRPWKEFLREALAYLDFGHYCFELIWEKRDGKIALADLAPRIPRSIQKWQLTDGSFGIRQVLQTNAVPVTFAEIPASKLLILTNDKEGDDVTGQSVLRSAYKHYVFNEILYKIQGISAERFGVGIPVVKLKEGSGAQDKTDAADMAGNIRSNEMGYIVLPPQVDTFVIQTPEGGAVQSGAMSAAIDHHSKQILMSVLANFLALGDGGVGSLALSEDKSSFFLQVVNDMASYFCEQIGSQVIRRIVDLNFGEQKYYPYLKFSSLGDVDFVNLSNALSTLATSGLVKPDAKIMQWVRREFKMPELTDDQMEMMEEQEIEAALGALESADSGGDMALPVDNMPAEPTGEEPTGEEPTEPVAPKPVPPPVA